MTRPRPNSERAVHERSKYPTWDEAADAARCDIMIAEMVNPGPPRRVIVCNACGTDGARCIAEEQGDACIGARRDGAVV